LLSCCRVVFLAPLNVVHLLFLRAIKEQPDLSGRKDNNGENWCCRSSWRVSFPFGAGIYWAHLYGTCYSIRVGSRNNNNATGLLFWNSSGLMPEFPIMVPSIHPRRADQHPIQTIPGPLSLSITPSGQLVPVPLLHTFQAPAINLQQLFSFSGSIGCYVYGIVCLPITPNFFFFFFFLAQ